MKRIVLILMLFLSVGHVSAFEDTFQRPDSYVLGDYWYVAGSYTSIGLTQIPVAYPTSWAVRLHIDPPTSNQGNLYFGSYDIYDLDYFAFTVRSAPSSSTNWDQAKLNFYDEDAVLISSTSDLVSHFVSNHDNDYYEFIKSAGSYFLYINGVSQGSIGFAPNDLASVELHIHVQNGLSLSVDIDDFTTNGNIIGMNENWTEASSTFDASYGIRSYASYPTSTFTMNARRISTGGNVNTTEVTSAAGFVSWNRLNTFGTNYGMYQAILKRDTETLATAVFNYGYSQNLGSIYFNKGSYTQGETATITYSLVTPDFSTYDYEAKIIDLSGNTLETWDIITASGTKTSTLADYNTGIHYVLFTRIEGATEIEFAYDYMTVTDYVSISGNTTNAITGAKIPSINVSYLQSSTYKNETSDTNGFFQVDNFQTGTPITSAIRENSTALWQYSPFSYTPLASGLFTMDMMLFPINHSYINATAYGLITDSVYNNPIESANITLQNGSWSDTIPSTATGYYYFTNLSEGEYTINASATGYITSTQVNITVPPAVNISWNASDNATGWASANSLSVDTTEKKEGTGSLESNGSASLDYSTTTSLVNTTTDYGRTNLSFWYYVNDTSKLTGDVNVTVGSSAEFGNNTVLLSFANTTLSNGWNYIEMPLFDGTLTGTLDMSTMDSFRLAVDKTDTVLSLLDDIRYIQDTRQVRYDIQLAQLYDLTITAKSSTTNALIQTFSIYEGSNTYGTVSATYTIENMEYGAYAVTVAADGYYSSGKTILMDEDKDVVFTLTPTPSGYYAPHEVLFTIKNIWGNVYSSVTTTVYLMSDLASVYLTGTTGSDGGVDFQLTENVQYKLIFANASQGVNKEFIVYPKEDHYYIYLSPFTITPDDGVGESITYYWTSDRINPTTGYINLTYTDTDNTTTSLEYWINETDGTPVIHGVAATPNDFTNSTTVPAADNTYIVKMSAVSTVHGAIGTTAPVTFFNGKRINFGWSEEWHYAVAAFIITTLIFGLFSAANVHIGGVIASLMTWMFVWFGWYGEWDFINKLLLIVATVISIGYAMRKGEVTRI